MVPDPRVDVDYRLLEALQEREQQLAEAQRVALVGSWSWRPETGEVQWSDQLYRLFGLRPRTPIDYETYVSRIDERDRPMLLGAVERALADHQPYRLRHRARLPDGTVRWIESRGAAEVDAAGAVVRLHGTAQDVTDAVAAETALRERDQVLALIGKVAQACNEATATATAAEAVLREVCEAGGWPAGAITPVGSGAGASLGAGAWYVAEGRLEGFRDAVERGGGPRAGGLGHSPPEPAVPLALTSVLGPEQAAEAKAAGLQGCLVFPVRVGSEVVAGLTVFSDRDEAPAPILVHAVRQAAVQLESVIQRDASEHRRLEEELQREREFLAAVLEGLDEPVVATDADGTLRFANGAARSCLAGLGDDAPARPISEWANCTPLHRPDDDAPLGPDEVPLVRALRGEVVTGFPLRVTPPGGEERHFVVNARPVPGRGGTVLGAVAVAHDVTEQRWADQLLRHHWHYDALTGLPHRTAFEQATEQALRRAAGKGWSTAVLALDFDRFSDVNERFGHDVGDQVLVAAARALQEAFTGPGNDGSSGAVVARLAGDQFGILCEDAGDPAAAMELAELAATAATAPAATRLDGHRLSASVGIALATTGPATDPSSLLLDAETAMQEARQRGGNDHRVFAEELRVEARYRIDLERDLAGAVERGELEVLYQPKLSLETERIIGAEALLRWRHPERGLISPAEFIPVAEATGLILPIGEWVLREACRQGCAWQDELPDRPPLMVCVNVSTRQFESSLVELVSGVLEETGLDPALLSLEVTESIAVGDIEQGIARLEALRALGVVMTIDDFGTGYSSLTYLRRLPLDELKIDKSFVDGLPDDPEAVAIVAATLGIAHALGLEVVAEGVETAAQLAQLRALGCDMVQGYHVAHPMPALDLVARIHEEQRLVLRGRGWDGTVTGDRVLVIDDDQEVRELVRMSLQTAGFRVEEAASGEQGVRMALETRPTCVLVDLHMPGISGVDVCRRLRSDPRAADATIVLLTASAEAATKADAFAAGADDYIVKPFAPRDLVMRARSAMRRRGDLQPLEG